MAGLQLIRATEALVSLAAFGFDVNLATPEDPMMKPLKIALDFTTFLSIGALFYAGILGEGSYITGKQEGFYILYLCIVWAVFAGDPNDLQTAFLGCGNGYTDPACWQWLAPPVFTWFNMAVLLPGYLLVLVFRKGSSPAKADTHPPLKKE